MKHAVKLAGDGLVEGIGIPFSGPWLGADGQGRDLYGEYFSARTELCLDWFAERPLLYQHGFDSGPQLAPVGRVKAWEVRTDGVWVQAQLDASSDYFEDIRELIDKGKLFFSSGSVGHLVEMTRSGEILRWPWVELSLTPTPANLFATIDQPTAEKHWQDSGLPVKTLTDRIKALPSSPTPVDGECGYPRGSYEALQHHIRRGAERLLAPMGWDTYVYVAATFPSYAVIAKSDWDEMTTDWFEVSYELDAQGMPVLGESRRVERVYVPATEPLPVEGMAAMSAHTLRSATTLLERTKDLRARRAAEGRPLSDANRARLESVRAALAGVLDEAAALLAVPDPTADDAAARARVSAEVQAALIRSIACAHGVEVLP